ncbi:toprim domain-containing protein [Bartonella sp. 220]|uniref:toprim domain-containing protein n=1 Tax=Bartonella sp. 220B TaxID=2967260 RepID=UPI0022A9421B|nr:toprim domain-containing protein [Bartonella sp. 220B]MCZ2158706.1 toprim domain-containing protein [Bartonella sp. 220B]
MSTIFEIKQHLISQPSTIAQMLLPKGQRRGNNWIVGNTRGEAGQSLSVCLSGEKAGLWYDFAEGRGGDLLDLWCEVKGINLSQALEEARTFLNLTRPKPFMVPRCSYRRPPVPAGGIPQNLVKTYLTKERCIPLEILKRYRIGEEGEKIIFPFYKPDGTLALVKERLAQAGAKPKPTTAHCEPILFGWQALFSTDHIPTAANHNPAATSHNPAAANHNPTATSHNPAATSHNPTATSHIPTAANHNPAATSHNPTATSHNPTATSHNPAATNHNPAAANHNPTATSHNPTATSHNPAAANHNPAATSHNPTATSHNPAAANHIPLTQAFSSTKRTIVITEGEIDALSLAAYGYPAVSVPFGGGSGGKHNWIENEFDHLESFETIFLATDMDKPGEEAAREIANRLGRHRCYRVHLPRKDANDCLTAGIDAATIKAAFSSAKSFAPEGLYHASDYKDKIIGLFWPTPKQHLGYTVPYPKLNGKLYFRPAELTLWSGASGAGKSQLLSDCIPHWISQNSRLCLASLEMKGEQSLRRLTKQTGGIEQPTKEMIERILHFLDDGLILYEHVGKSSVDRLLDVFDYCRARYGCDQFIIDSLMRLGICSDDYAGQEQAVYKMVDWAILNAVHIHLVAHARKGGLDKDIPGTEDIKGASEIGANAFNIITVWRNRSLEDKIFAAPRQEEKAELGKRPGVIMNIAKQRSGDFEGKIGLWFDQKTYRYRCSQEQLLTQRRYLEDPRKNPFSKNQTDTIRTHLMPS